MHLTGLLLAGWQQVTSKQMHALTLLSYRHSCCLTGTPCSQVPLEHQHESSTHLIPLPGPSAPHSLLKQLKFATGLNKLNQTHTWGQTMWKYSHPACPQQQAPGRQAVTCGCSPNAVPCASLASLATVSPIAVSRTYVVSVHVRTYAVSVPVSRAKSLAHFCCWHHRLEGPTLLVLPGCWPHYPLTPHTWLSGM